MRRRCLSYHSFVSLLVIATCIVGLLSSSRTTAAESGLINNLRAERYGLERAWFSQTQLDRTRHKVQRAILNDDLLLVLTTAGVVHAMDAETGRTVWTTRIGNPNYPSMGPAVNDKYVALVNGSTVSVLSRDNGELVLSRELSGGAGGGPALTRKHVYVPMFSGKMDAYPLDDQRQSPWYYASTGRVFDAPVSTPNSVAWPTDRGYLYVANSAGNGVRYRFESSGRINGAPAAYDGNLYATSSNGYLYAINEQNGQQRWRYSTGESIVHSPLVVSGKIYVATEEPALHCVSTTGQVQWHSPRIAQLVGVSKTRVYGMNRTGYLTVLDKTSGVPLGQLRSSTATTAVANDQTDRLYLISETGLVQCLHEIGSDKPYLHSDVTPEDETAEAGDATDAEPDAPSNEPATNPDDTEPEIANPFDAPADSSNPFGGGGNDDDANPFDF